jgi:hypothetical protein
MKKDTTHTAPYDETPDDIDALLKGRGALNDTEMNDADPFLADAKEGLSLIRDEQDRKRILRNVDRSLLEALSPSTKYRKAKKGKAALGVWAWSAVAFMLILACVAFGMLRFLLP